MIREHTVRLGGPCIIPIQKLCISKANVSLQVHIRTIVYLYGPVVVVGDVRTMDIIYLGVAGRLCSDEGGHEVQYAGELSKAGRARLHRSYSTWGHRCKPPLIQVQSSPWLNDAEICRQSDSQSPCDQSIETVAPGARWV